MSRPVCGNAFGGTGGMDLGSGRRVVAALAAAILAVALSACAGDAETPQQEPAAPVQGPSLPQEAEGEDEQPGWGHASFAGGDGYSVITNSWELSNAFDAQLEGMDLQLAIVPDDSSGGEDAGDFLLVLHQDSPGAGRDQAISCIRELAGSRIHGEVMLDNGVTFYYSRQAGEGAGDPLEAYLVEPGEDGVWVTIVSSSIGDGGGPGGEEGILSLVNVGRKRVLADLVLQPGSYDGATVRVGSPGVGWVDVPGAWVEAPDADLPSAVVWREPSGAASVTLGVLSFEDVAWEEVAQENGFEVTAEDLAMALAYNAMAEFDQQDGAEVTSAYQLTVAGAVTYCVEAELPDGAMATVLLVAGDQAAHVVRVEGDPVAVDGEVWLAVGTFSPRE